MSDRETACHRRTTLSGDQCRRFRARAGLRRVKRRRLPRDPVRILTSRGNDDWLKDCGADHDEVAGPFLTTPTIATDGRQEPKVGCMFNQNGRDLL
jgi:hypothetical protein